MNSRLNYFGLIGNGETAALIGPDLALGWFCAPRFDGVPLFASALDPRRGGSMTFEFADAEGPVQLMPHLQAYEGDSAVLRTAVSGDDWLVEALDYMPWGRRVLVRQVTISNLAPHSRVLRIRAVTAPIRSEQFPLQVSRHSGVVTVAAPGMTVLVAPISASESEEIDLGEIPAGAAREIRVAVAYGDDLDTARAALESAAEASAEAELRFWSEWLSKATKPTGDYPPQWEESYWRSLVVMKLLSYAPTGALIAAPTASFPAVPGGGDNWDYRYIWLRDGYYTAMTFNAAGLHEEAARFYDFAFGLQGADGHWTQPLYTVDGGDPQEFIARDLEGPSGEVPIRFGNAASGQLQLDNEGNILHGLWFHYLTSGDRTLLERHWDGVRRACNWTAANWRSMESGIWELREYTAHWVHGKVMCCAALNAGARIAELLGHPAEAAAWQAQAEAVRADVLAGGWSEERSAYLAHYGNESQPPHVDISVLALVFYGLLPAGDPRVLATVKLIEQDQTQGGLALHEGICRYDYGAVPFYLPTLWLARYYLMAGRLEDCDRLVQICIDCSTNLGLMAEHFDGRDLKQWGNFPQAFSHEEVARLVLERGQGWSFYELKNSSLGVTEPRG
ncbi:MAG: glycoside hydrolase family 15 protein [Bacillota bacterium]